MNTFKKTSDTLKFISTHIINQNVINEYQKLLKSGDDVILCIDNTELKIESDSAICQKEFYNTKVNCFLFDINIHKKLNLPCFYSSFEDENFKKIMWYNGDYRFYYVKQYFPNYKYYWQLDYDVYFNGESYSTFFEKYKNKTTDLLVCHFRGELINSSWCWTKKIGWIYDDSIELYGSFFPVCRLSNQAITYLYNKRICHAKKFKNYVNSPNSAKWLNCEIFTPTELVNGGFKCNTIEEKTIDLKEYYQNDKCFKSPDNKIYHPYKGEFLRYMFKIPGIKISWKVKIRTKARP